MKKIFKLRIPAKISRCLRLYRNISIKKKLLLVLYIQILIPLVFIGFFSFKTSETIITNKSLSSSNDLLKLIELRLQDTVRNLNIISQDISNDQRVYSALINNNDYENRLTNYEIASQVNNVFLSIAISRPEIESMCIVTNDKNIYNYDSSTSDIKSMATQNYYELKKLAAEASGKVVWYFNSKEGVVENSYLIKTMYHRDNYKEVGFLIIQINMDFLGSALQGLKSELMQNTTILSPDNEIILSNNYTQLQSYDKIIKAIPYQKDSFIDKENNIFVACTTLSDLRWRILTYVPLNQLYKDVKLLRNNIIFLCFASIFLLSLVSIFMSYDLIKPINQLVKAMENMNINKMSESNIVIARDDELGFLHKKFNIMTKEMDHLVTWVYKEQITRKEAEIKALQSQINPHFLFNTLESINWMAQLNNVPEISDTVNDLSALLEASIGRDDRLITIEEEFTYIDRYISLLKRRFDDKIILNKEVDPKVLYVKIPRLLIQPLIENAVYHGVENSRGKGIISLVAYTMEELLVIEVIDNGTGISADELSRLNKYLEMDNETYFKSLGTRQNKSIGIDNVNRRIKLFYGEEYGIKLEIKINIYTKVTVFIPSQNSNIKESYYVQGTNN